MPTVKRKPRRPRSKLGTSMNGLKGISLNTPGFPLDELNQEPQEFLVNPLNTFKRRKESAMRKKGSRVQKGPKTNTNLPDFKGELNTNPKRRKATNHVTKKA